MALGKKFGGNAKKDTNGKQQYIIETKVVVAPFVIRRNESKRIVKEKILKNNKRTYLIMIICGVILTLSLIATIWTNDEIDLIFNILAMLGSGVFCSAIVSWIVEHNNIKMIKEERLIQSKFVLRRVFNRLNTYIFWEIGQLSQYSLLSIEDSKKKREFNEYTQKEIIDKINEYLLAINNSVESIYQWSDVIDSKYLKRVEKRDSLVFKQILPIVKRLKEEITNVLSDVSMYYINEVLDDDKVKALEELEIMLVDIINFSEGESIELTLEFKKMFFENLQGILERLEVNLKDKMKVIIWKEKAVPSQK